MGNCNNLGENSVYILKKRNMECPINYNGYESKFDGYWFSGNKNLSEVNLGESYGIHDQTMTEERLV